MSSVNAHVHMGRATETAEGSSLLILCQPHRGLLVFVWPVLGVGHVSHSGSLTGALCPAIEIS